jgi:hypothetical protein
VLVRDERTALTRVRRVLHLLVDTSTWLDLGKRRGGQKWIVAMRQLVEWEQLELLVPALVVDEYERNRSRVEASMTASVAERFRLLKADFADYGSDDDAAEALSRLAFQTPLIGAMATRNFDDIAALLVQGRRLEATAAESQAVVQRALDKQAPFHRAKNSVADALLIECYASAVRDVDLGDEPHGFITSNSQDFSAPAGDHRQPHEDLAPLFTDAGSLYGVGVDGLDTVLRDQLGEDYDELLDELYFEEEPRRLDEILSAEQDLFDRIWYNRSLFHEGGLDADELADLLRVAGPGRRRVEQKFGVSNLGPYSDFEWGMLSGKLSALRWVLGNEWDFLDT